MRATYEIVTPEGQPTVICVEGTKSGQYGLVGEGVNRISAMHNAVNNLRRLADQIDRAITSENK